MEASVPPALIRRSPTASDECFWSATALVIASLPGTGVFTTSGFLMADLNSRWFVLGLGWVFWRLNVRR